VAKKKRPKDTQEQQHARFVAMAKEVEADESPDALEKALKKMNVRNADTTRKSRGT
jgi:hypothetical protein